MNAYWTDPPAPRTIANRDQLGELLQEVGALGRPTMLYLERQDAGTLVVGLGARETVLTFIEPDGASYHSRGDITRTDVLRFWNAELFDEFLGEMAVPAALAVIAAHEFFASDGAPPSVRWEADA